MHLNFLNAYNVEQALIAVKLGLCHPQGHARLATIAQRVQLQQLRMHANQVTIAQLDLQLNYFALEALTQAQRDSQRA